MNEAVNTHSEINGRRNFLKRLSAGAAGLALGSLYSAGDASARNAAPKNSRVSFVTGNDQREAAFQALKSLEKEIKKAIQDKQVVIKVNMGQIRKDWWLNASDANQVRGILDFLAPIYKKKVIVTAR